MCSSSLTGYIVDWSIYVTLQFANVLSNAGSLISVLQLFVSK